MSEVRSLPVPDGLAGDRVDAGLARLLGMSRTKAADLAEKGAVSVDGRSVGKSDGLPAGGRLIVDLPDVRTPTAPEPVPGLRIPYAAPAPAPIDHPARVAAHPTPGWDGPTVVAAPTAAGVHLARAGPAERARILHRLDAGPSGLMIVAKYDPAYSVLKRAFKERT